MTRFSTIFSKRPRPGTVKTRLVPPLTPEQAAQLAQAMLDDAVAALASDPRLNAGLAVAPAAELDWFRARYAGLATVAVQTGVDLAERLAAWFDSRCARGRTEVVVGSDCPLVTPRLVHAAHAALEAGADAVFVPDLGGGYCLVGMARSVPTLFTSIRMSTASMLNETLALARTLLLDVHLLPALYDVDVARDLTRLQHDLAAWDRTTVPDPFPARTFELLSTLDLSRV